ncbi:MAG: peptidoglycan DD-metalloendopeptidase family protein [Lachnospiraceae bacterium]|nr:peptidoglycan DD-metalloendopeptidase family protein [Lachnospiraceae bacterium]
MLLEILSRIVNMSMTASIVIIAVLLLRLVLRKAPKVYSYLLWFIVLFRLLCPVSISSAVSLMGMFDTPVTEDGVITYIPYADNLGREITAVNFEIIPDGFASEEMYGVEKMETTFDLRAILAVTGGTLWSVGVVVLLIYSIFSLVRLKKNLVGSVKLDDGIYRADHIVTPFVMGIIYPRIYLPSDLTETEKDYILMHEKHHIKRGDHIFKILFYVTLCVYWFNPLVWVAFYLFVKDMEMSCDEAVMNHMTEDIRAEYSSSLLCLATGRRMMTGVPLAFGEGDTGDRIKNILNWKRPRVWVALAAVVLVLTAVVVLSTNPEASDGNGEEVNDTVFEETEETGVYTSVEDALRAAVINYNQTYAVPADFHCASVAVLIAVYGQQGDNLSTVDYYVYSLYKDMDLSEDGIRELVTVSVPMIITLTTDADGGYHIEEDGVTSVNEFTGEDYEKYMEENYPELNVAEGSRVLSNLYEKVLCMDCHAQAVEYGQLDTDAIIGGLVDYIAEEPLVSSSTQEYISHSPVEYRELIYYGKYTIAYAEAYRQTGVTDLKMAILDCAEAEIRTYIERTDEAKQEQSESNDTIAGQERNELMELQEQLNEHIAIVEQERNELNSQLEQIEGMIDITEQERSALITQLEQIDEQISQLEQYDELIAVTEQERNELIAQLEQIDELIAITEQELNRLMAQKEQLDELIEVQVQNNILLDAMVWPTTGSTISQAYGNLQRFDGETYFSDHICIAGEEGDPVYAAMDGVVEETGYTADYGNYIVILGGDEIRTRYGYLKSVEVTEGTQVAVGEEIGTVGRTGRVTGNCLGFAITDHGVPIDPSGIAR